jgi:uncharacterized membrane protein (DUF373 family)
LSGRPAAAGSGLIPPWRNPAQRLVAQPFIVVGLVAVIRKILLVLSNPASFDTTQLWLLIAMVVAFVAGLIAVSRFEKKEE